MAKLVSKVYGDALFEAARDCGKMDEIFEEVQSIRSDPRRKCRASEDSRKSESYA